MAPFLTVTDCDAIVRQSETFQFEKAPIARGAEPPRVVPEIRYAERFDFDVTSSPALGGLGLGHAPERLFELARDIDRVHLRTGLTRVQGMQLIRYAPGGHHSWHRDSRDPSFRKVSLIAYLNDAASGSFEGGDTVFARNRAVKHLHPTVYVPRCGEVVVFDSQIQHRAKPISRGRKLVLLMLFV